MRPGRLPPERMYPAGIPGIRVRYVTVAGVAIRVLESGPDSGDAVILVHGWGACVYSWAETIPALASAGHRVIALDLPGFGLSAAPRDERCYETRFTADVVTGVARAVDAARYTLIAHSMGGAVALDIATRGEAALQRLVLINAVGLGFVPAIGPLKLISPSVVDRFTPRIITRRFLRLVLRSAYATGERPTQRDVDEYFAPTQFESYAFACRATVHRARWARVPATRLRSLRIPVLVITGRRDLMIRRSGARARLIPNAQVVSCSDAGHLVMQERSSVTNAEIIRFLRDAASRGTG